MALRIDADRVRVLDQRRLPAEELWVDASHPEAMIEMIRVLAVRGAPLIGVCAAASLAWAAPRMKRALWEAWAVELRAARPTAVNLAWAVDRMVAAADPVATALAIFDQDATLCTQMAEHGAGLVADGESVLTHCNTGALATAGVGTALGVIRRAGEQGKAIHVWVDETRPLLQGARLTTWELRKLGIPHTLITDGTAAMLMARGKVQRVVVGADRVARNGDFANKIGTYSAAVAAWHHDIPFHCVAPWTTFDRECADGAAIPIEERSPDEVRVDPRTPVYNPAFDVTPGALVTSFVTDRGVFRPAEWAD